MNPLMNALGMMRGNPFGNVQNVMQRVNQMQGIFQNPQMLVQQFFPDVPAEMQGDPEKIQQYLIDQGRITKQQLEQIKKTFPQR